MSKEMTPEIFFTLSTSWLESNPSTYISQYFTTSTLAATQTFQNAPVSQLCLTPASVFDVLLAQKYLRRIKNQTSWNPSYN